MSDELAWETLDSEIAYSCPGFDVLRDAVRLPDGTETAYDYLVEPPSVVVLPFTPAGRVVVIDEWRHAVGRLSRGFPAGGIEAADADPAAAARRELAEETGYVAGEVEALLAVEPANGVANVVHHYFLARDCRPEAGQELDANESIRVDTTTLPRLRAAVERGEIRDGRTVLGTLLYDRLVAGRPEGP